MALLADSEYNADRVVGAKEIRGADPGYFPAGDPLLLDRDRLADDQGFDDRVAAEQPRRLVLERVVMTESASEGIPARLPHRFGDFALRGRNVLSLESEGLVECRR